MRRVMLVAACLGLAVVAGMYFYGRSADQKQK